MTSALVEFAPAKVNLTLRVLGRRADGYHELESLVAFAGCGDRLTLQPGDGTDLYLSGPTACDSGAITDNLVMRAANALASAVPGIRSGTFHLHKTLPVAAGIGGGSSDAAAALRLLASLNDLALDDTRLMAVAAMLGADVPVCVDPRPRIMRGVGDRLGPPLALPLLSAILVNPRVPLSTRDVFARLVIRKPDAEHGDPPSDRDALTAFLAAQANDLTNAAIACVPAVGDVLRALGRLPNIRLARMSGSGPTCFALFGTEAEAVSAARALSEERPGWWIAATVLGAGGRSP